MLAFPMLRHNRLDQRRSAKPNAAHGWPGRLSGTHSLLTETFKNHALSQFDSLGNGRRRPSHSLLRQYRIADQRTSKQRSTRAIGFVFVAGRSPVRRLAGDSGLGLFAPGLLS